MGFMYTSSCESIRGPTRSTTKTEGGAMHLRNLALVLLVSLMAVALAACGGGTAAPTATTAPPAPTAPPAQMPAGALDYTIHLMNVSGAYAFDPKNLTLTAGKSYTIKLVPDGEFHTWTVKNPAGGNFINAQVLPNTPQTITFIAPAAGTYKLVCIPHEALNMVGQITTK
ncbi:MAG: hypothetical protein EXR55_04450 [Dehalococcoidia bacterium]|nr:hypothetical protein [Dehalococcoidia bacterium]